MGQSVGLTIDDLLLDTDNPRIGHSGNQREALQQVLDDQEEKLYKLAENIVQEGMNPLKRLLVIEEKKGSHRYISLEGNRRVAALKILVNPAVLTSLKLKAALQKRLEQLAADFNRASVEPIACVIVKDRQEAAPWIHLEHTGENEGRGVVAWSGIAASRFRGTDPALQALDFVRKHGVLTADEQQKIEDSFPISTFDRLLSTPDVRKRIGVEVKNGKLWSELPAEELIKPLRRIVLDLLHKRKNVNHLKLKGQQVAYVDAWGADSKPNLGKKQATRTIESITGNEFKSKTTRSKTASRKADPSDRKKVVQSGCKLNVTDNRIASIFKELRSLNIVDAPNAIAVLLRVFLELSTDHYLAANSIPLQVKTPRNEMKDKSLKAKVQEAVDHLVSQGSVRKDFIGITRALTVPTSPLNIDLLHAYVHNRFAVPKPVDLLGAWDEAQHFLEKLWQ